MLPVCRGGEGGGTGDLRIIYKNTTYVVVLFLLLKKNEAEERKIMEGW